MKRISFSKVAKYTTAIWLVVVGLYGWYSVSNMMEYLKANPEGDLYANNLGFQIVAFAFTKGLASIVLLGLVLIAEATLLVKKEARSE